MDHVVPLPQRVTDVTVVEAIASEAGVEEAPEVVHLNPVIQPVIQLQRRPPLAVSGYFPGTMGVSSGAVALNTSHCAIFVSGFNNAIGRVNWIKIKNTTSSVLLYNIFRLDSPFTGFTAVKLKPGYINAGGKDTGAVFSLTRNNTVAGQGTIMANIQIEPDTKEQIDGPWILNDGALGVFCTTVNTAVRFEAGYEIWPASRVQPPG